MTDSLGNIRNFAGMISLHGKRIDGISADSGTNWTFSAYLQHFTQCSLSSLAGYFIIRECRPAHAISFLNRDSTVAQDGRRTDREPGHGWRRQQEDRPGHSHRDLFCELRFRLHLNRNQQRRDHGPFFWNGGIREIDDVGWLQITLIPVGQPEYWHGSLLVLAYMLIVERVRRTGRTLSRNMLIDGVCRMSKLKPSWLLISQNFPLRLWVLLVALLPFGSLCGWGATPLHPGGDCGKLCGHNSGPTSGRIRGCGFPHDRRRQWKPLGIGHRESEWNSFFQCHRGRNLHGKF